MPQSGSSDEYAVVIQPMPSSQFKCRLLQRTDFPICVCALLSHQKGRVPTLHPGDILLVDASDYDRSERGTGDILEVVHDAKEIKRLRKAGTIPEEADMPKIPTKEHHHQKKDKRLHGERGVPDEEEVESRNKEVGVQPPPPKLGADDEDESEPCDGHAESVSDDDGKDGRRRGKRISKAALKAQAAERSEVVTESKRVRHTLDTVDQLQANLDEL